MAYGGPFQPSPPVPRTYQGVGGLINQLHGAMVHEPRAEHVSQFAKMLATLTGLQQKEHAEMNQRPRTGFAPAAPVSGFQSPLPTRGGVVADAGYDTGQGAAEAAAAMAARYGPLQTLIGGMSQPQPVFHPSDTILAALRGTRFGGPVY